MTKILLFAQIINKLGKEIFSRFVKAKGTDKVAFVRILGQPYRY